MRILTFASSTAVLLPLLSLNAWANPANQSQPSTLKFSPTKDKQISQQNSTVPADNSWSNSNQKELEGVKFQLQNISQRNFTPSRGVPSLTIANPYGFGADRGFFSGLSYQTDTRGGLDGVNNRDGTFGFGLGLGNAQKSVGAELSYSAASFGQNDRDFGSGGFNLKLHRKIADGWGVAAGWNSFLSIGDGNDLDDSLYFATTKIFRTRENVNSAFSRVGATIGVGNGQFRTEDSIANDNNNFNVFGSLAFRVARPVSFITEWTGQDLGMGLSVSPFRAVPLTINLGARDIAGAGDGARFVFGVGAGI
ncbi:hypothetical protein [Pleurocapsa sp. FMAR1]|uniref:hypothetical protein n=1 Tax=Pleurocapsa sp. FMAR1 TaxID=3040204 RepID=UPI0029C975E7|nr:hypothetical protein [Pleurocapsa sp. FMAR1]